MSSRLACFNVKHAQHVCRFTQHSSAYPQKNYCDNPCALWHWFLTHLWMHLHRCVGLHTGACCICPHVSLSSSWITCDTEDTSIVPFTLCRTTCCPCVSMKSIRIKWMCSIRWTRKWTLLWPRDIMVSTNEEFVLWRKIKARSGKHKESSTGYKYFL